MKIKKGDLVQVILGKDRGKTGKVFQVLPKDHRIVVEGLNKRIKHVKAQKQGEKGERIDFWAPMQVSNVQLVCPKCNKLTRVGYMIQRSEVSSASEPKKKASRQKVRMCKKCKAVL